MAQSINIATRPWPVGTYVQTINNLHPNSTGFDFSMGWGTWPEGPCARVFIEFSTDNGVTFSPWIDHTFNGGTGNNRDGTPRTSVTLSGTWPGENDGTGGRRAIKGSAVRGTLTVMQPVLASLNFSQTT